MHDISDDRSISVYLLHFDDAFKGKQHYIGSTQTSRLARRMQEHALGLGSATTRRFVRESIGFTVARVWWSSSRDLEKTLKRGAHYTKFCPVCLKEKSPTAQAHYVARPWSPQSERDWPNKKSVGRS